MARKATAVKTRKPKHPCPDPSDPSDPPAPAPPVTGQTETVVWAFKELAILNNRTGIVACLQEVADQVIADGKAQDMRDGLLALKPIEAGSDPDHSGDNAMNAFPYRPAGHVAPVPAALHFDGFDPAGGSSALPISTGVTLHPMFRGGPIPAGGQTVTVAFTATPALTGSMPPLTLPAGKTQLEAVQLIASAIATGFSGEVSTRDVIVDSNDPTMTSFFLTYTKAGGTTLDTATFTFS